VFRYCPHIVPGGFHKRSGGRHWKRHMEKYWAVTTPAGRICFKAGPKERRERC